MSAHPKLPNIHASVPAITDPTDAVSIATAAAYASMELLIAVSAKERGTVTLDRIAIVKPTGPRLVLSPAQDLFGLLGSIAAGSAHAVMVSCKVHPPEPEPKSEAEDDVAEDVAEAKA